MLTDLPCQPFPGPGIDHLYTFNPMREFVELDTDYVNDTFHKFVNHHDKKYSNMTEHLYRKQIFNHNLR